MTSRFEDHAVVVTTDRLAARRLEAVASGSFRGKGYRLNTRVRRSGHALSFRFGMRHLNILLSHKDDPLFDGVEAIHRIELDPVGDEILLEEDRYQLSFLARPYEPRVEREFDTMLQTLVESARAHEGALIVEGPDGPAVIQVLGRPRGATVETHRPLPEAGLVLSTFTNFELR